MQNKQLQQQVVNTMSTPSNHELLAVLGSPIGVNTASVSVLKSAIATIEDEDKNLTPFIN